jgi:hypothetical protein
MTIGLVMATIYVNYEPSKFVTYWWLPASDSNRGPLVYDPTIASRKAIAALCVALFEQADGY